MRIVKILKNVDGDGFLGNGFSLIGSVAGGHKLNPDSVPENKESNGNGDDKDNNNLNPTGLAVIGKKFTIA